MTDADETAGAGRADPTTARSVELRALAGHYVAELPRHPVLAAYWDRISLVLKGSTARGNADHLSDLDFVFFAGEDDRRAIVDGYYRAGLTARRDGVFLPLGDWIGHYHFESFEHLAGHFTARHLPHVWEYRGALALHDPGGRFRRIMDLGLADLFRDPLPDVRSAYLDLQLTLDWLRHPLKRADAVATLLHCSRLIQGLCQISYLLDASPYPHDKWLFHYLDTTRFGRAHRCEHPALPGRRRRGPQRPARPAARRIPPVRRRRRAHRPGRRRHPRAVRGSAVAGQNGICTCESRRN